MSNQVTVGFSNLENLLSVNIAKEVGENNDVALLINERI